MFACHKERVHKKQKTQKETRSMSMIRKTPLRLSCQCIHHPAQRYDWETKHDKYFQNRQQIHLEQTEKISDQFMRNTLCRGRGANFISQFMYFHSISFHFHQLLAACIISLYDTSLIISPKIIVYFKYVKCGIIGSLTSRIIELTRIAARRQTVAIGYTAG